jgi:hypothetical protein
LVHMQYDEVMIGIHTENTVDHPEELAKEK